MTLREQAVLLWANDTTKLTINQMAELIIANEANDYELPKLKKSLSIATTTWKGFTREKIDGKIHVDYKTPTQDKAVTVKTPPTKKPATKKSLKNVQDISEMR